MESRVSGRMKAAGVTLLLGAGLVGAAVQVMGLPVRTPPRPVAAAVPAAPKPRPAVAVLPAALPETVAPPVDGGAFVVRRILDVPSPFRHGDYVWNEEGAPAAGPLVITVDLAAQTLSVFRDGYEIGAAVILYGADEKPTPLGVYPITQKDADHVSNLYDAPMPYMLRLTNDGVSIHGSEVDWHYATHGCIGVPVKFARLLFGRAKLGDKVIVTNGERLDIGQPIPAA